MNSLHSFSTWLAATPASQAIQTAEWVIPAVQTVHILCVAAVMTSALMVDLKLLGVGPKDLSIASTARRFLPFLWWPLPVLLATGSILIVAEPARALENPVFLLKMGLLMAAVAVTLASAMPLRREASFWEGTAGRRRMARVLALASLPLWIGILFAGRWIAYIHVT